MKSRRPVFGAAVVVVTLTAAACSSTTAANSAKGQRVGPAGRLAAVPSSAEPAVAGSGRSGGPAGAAQGSTGGPTGGAPTAVHGASATSIPLTGRGWDAKNVYIGLVTVKDKAQAAHALGSSEDPGDLEGQARAVANYYNSRGGLFGRKVVIRFDDHRALSVVGQPDQEAQASCTKFTQDTPVIAVINGDISTQSYWSCLAKAGIPLLGTGNAVDDKAFRDHHGLLFSMTFASWSKLAPVFVDRLKAQRYFRSWNTLDGASGNAPVRVGAFIPDDPVSARSYSLLAAALAKAGHAPVTVYRYTNWQHEGNSAVLQMKDNNVTHVIGLDWTLFTFALAAESQRYRPRYGVHSNNIIAPTMGTDVPAAQNVGAVGVGTVPTTDVSSSPNDLTPGGTHCLEILAAGGQRFGNNRYAMAYAFQSCDGIRLTVESALAGGGLTGQAILAGAGKIGPSFAPALTFVSGLRPSYPVLPGAVMDVRYETSCSCYRYPNTVLHRL